jgi:RND family efflux transporter MFP subunit
MKYSEASTGMISANVRKTVVGIGAAGAVLTIAALLTHSLATRADSAVEAQHQAIPVARVGSADLRQQLELPGEFRPYQEVDIDAKVKGYIKALPVDVGDRVARGQLLAQLEIPEAEANLTKAIAEVERAKQRSLQSQAIAADAKEMYERLAGVMKERPDLVAQQDIDQMKAKADAANAAAIADRSAVAEAQAQKREWSDMVGYAKIDAPFSGVVTKLYANLGALVGDGGSRGDHAASSVMHIAELDHLRLVLKIPESVVPKLHEGTPVNVTIPALQKTATLPIARMSHDIDLATRTMHVEVDYPNGDGAVTPGSYADVELPVALHKNVLSVPLQALNARKNDAAKVYVLHGDGSIEMRAVTLGIVTATQAEICSGLRGGELVATAPVPQQRTGVVFVPQIMAAR